jgi:cell division protein FtsB
MNTKHIFISVLDVEEQLPFAVKKKAKLQEKLAEQERAREELTRFINKLEKNFKENIHYLGMDVIGEKAYERFMFSKSGFLEIMVEQPVALNAHFPDKKRAQTFCKILKKTIGQIIKDSPQKNIFLDSIEVFDEDDTSLTVEDWKKIKNIRG